MPYNPNIHHRKSIRLKGYDYAQAGLYFITICTQNRACLFGEIENGEMVLNDVGMMVEKWYNELENKFSDIRCHEMVIMPNHIHGIIEIIFNKGKEEKEEKNLKEKESIKDKNLKFKSPSQTIGSIIRGYKIATIKRIKDLIISHSEKGESSSREGESSSIRSTGELQFAPTGPTTARNEIIKSLDFKIWQRNYYEHIIRNEKAYQRISEYIINNPKNWDNDKLK